MIWKSLGCRVVNRVPQGSPMAKTLGACGPSGFGLGTSLGTPFTTLSLRLFQMMSHSFQSSLLLVLIPASAHSYQCSFLLVLTPASAHSSQCSLPLVCTPDSATSCKCSLLLLLTPASFHSCQFSPQLLITPASTHHCQCSLLLALILASAHSCSLLRTDAAVQCSAVQWTGTGWGPLSGLALACRVSTNTSNKVWLSAGGVLHQSIQSTET